MCKLTPTLEAFLEEEGYYMIKEIPGKGICALLKLIFTTGLVVGIDQTGYVGRYCYTHPIHAQKALALWDGTGDPSGDWIKWKGLGGDRSRVYDEYDSDYHMPSTNTA